MFSTYLVQDPKLPEIRSWTEWSNSNDPGIDYAPLICQEGEYVTDFRWHQDPDGFCDVKIRCSGSGWSKHATDCENWNHPYAHFWTEVNNLHIYFEFHD